MGKKKGVSDTPYDGGWWVTDGGWWVSDGGWWVATKHQRVDAIVKKRGGVSVLMAPPGSNLQAGHTTQGVSGGKENGCATPTVSGRNELAMWPLLWRGTWKWRCNLGEKWIVPLCRGLRATCSPNQGPLDGRGYLSLFYLSFLPAPHFGGGWRSRTAGHLPITDQMSRPSTHRRWLNVVSPHMNSCTCAAVPIWKQVQMGGFLRSWADNGTMGIPLVLWGLPCPQIAAPLPLHPPARKKGWWCSTLSKNGK